MRQPAQVRAPFSEDQVASLNEFQDCLWFHQFTCGTCGGVLVATADGWVCRVEPCDYRQDWAHDYMANWEWRRVEMAYGSKARRSQQRFNG